MKPYNVYPLYDVEPIKGQGAHVYDAQGKRYLDFYGGHAVISIGHSHPHYIKRITEQLQSIGFYSNSIINNLQNEFSDKLEKLSGVKGYDLFFINSGAEANDNALKLASFYKNSKKVIALENSFHGRTSAAVNVTHTGSKYQAPINHGVDVTYFKVEDIEGIIGALSKGDVSSVIIEAIQGVGGLDMMSVEGLEKIARACREYDTVLIMDEVQCGYARSGRFFAFQYANIFPDIITMAKGMGNGFPIGGVLINTERMPAVTGRLGTTYGGNHLACAAGLAVLEVIESEKLIHNAARRGEELKSILNEVKGVKRIKGQGLMIGAEFDFPVAGLRKKLVMEYGLFTGSSGNPNLIRILPPLNITGEHLDEFSQKMNKAVASL